MTPSPSAERTFLRHILPLVCALQIACPIFAGHAAPPSAADRAWAEITAMEKGPAGSPENRREALSGVASHLRVHLRLLDAFVADHPNDSRRFSAELQRSAIMASLGKLTGDSAMLREARRLAEALEKSPDITPQQAADAGFQRVSLLFLEAQNAPDSARDTLVNASRNFVARYPSDPRGARLLAEVATLLDSNPPAKRELLEAALRSARDPDLKARVHDDLRQLDLLGRPVPLSFPTLSDGRFSIDQHRGKVVLILFWSSDSPHSLWWLQQNLPALREFPPSSLVIATISLDSDRARLQTALSETGITFPTAWDGLAWESPLARNHGINRLPTVWIFDRTGRLRAGNATRETTGLIRRLIKERL